MRMAEDDVKKKTAEEEGSGGGQHQSANNELQNGSRRLSSFRYQKSAQYAIW